MIPRSISTFILYCILSLCFLFEIHAISGESDKSLENEAVQTQDSIIQRNIFEQLKKDQFKWGKVIISQDTSIQNLVNRHVKLNKQYEGIPGYRIRIFSINPNLVQNARKRAIAEKNKFEKAYPDIPTYLRYESLRYKVYIGDFRTRLAAEQCLQKIKSDYPHAFRVNDRINYK